MNNYHHFTGNVSLLDSKSQIHTYHVLKTFKFGERCGYISIENMSINMDILSYIIQISPDRNEYTLVNRSLLKSKYDILSAIQSFQTLTEILFSKIGESRNMNLFLRNKNYNSILYIFNPDNNGSYKTMRAGIFKYDISYNNSDNLMSKKRYISFDQAYDDLMLL